MTQGSLGHTGAQGRAKGFHSVVSKFPKVQVLDEQPADWDVTKVARIWESLLTKYPKIDAAFFHNDDMALAAYKVMQAKGRTETKIGGIDVMPPAIKAVQAGEMYATVRNPRMRARKSTTLLVSVNSDLSDRVHSLPTLYPVGSCDPEP